MNRMLTLLMCLTLCACATGPKVQSLWTDAEGVQHVIYKPVPMIKPTWSDGTPIPKETLAGLGWTPPKRQPTWQCMGADFGSTGVGLALGLAEANPLGWIALPVGIAGNVMARQAEEKGDDRLAKLSARVHCGAAVWNILTIALFLL